MKLLYESNEIPRDSFLHALVATIECSPGDKEIWMQFISVLGTVSHNKSIDIKTQQGVDSNLLGSWWDRIRATRWEEEFFCAPKSATTLVKPEFVQMVLDAISSFPLLTKQYFLSSKRKQEIPNISAGKSSTFDDANQRCTSWISRWTDEELLSGFEDKIVAYDKVDFDLFPRKNNSNFCGTTNFDPMNESLKEIQDRLSTAPSCEAMCFKIVAACHLFGIHHGFVLDAIWLLSVKLWQSQTRKQAQLLESAKDALYWLTLCGLNIPKILRIKRDKARRIT